LSDSEAVVGSIAHAIQLAVAPVFLLTGIAGVLNVLAGRLARIIDRGRKIEAGDAADLGAYGPDAAPAELLVLRGRALLIQVAISLATGAALMVASVVVVLFFGSALSMSFGPTIPALFILGMLLLICSLLLFLREIYLAVRHLRIGSIRPVPPPP